MVDIKNPAAPKTGRACSPPSGALNDTRAVQVGSVNASMFALVADGKNGLKVLQLISPDTVPEHMGFTPRPAPRLIASFPIKHGEAQAISRGLDRDRVTDETGQQTVVFGRRGARAVPPGRDARLPAPPRRHALPRGRHRLPPRRVRGRH